MTARLATQGSIKSFKVYDTNKQQVQIKLDPSIRGTQASQNPQNFLDKKKNELGLHDLSAVLLKPNTALSKQLFPKSGSYAIFMPIPLEEDLQLFEELSQAAKRNRGGELYKFVVDARSRMTRIKYGATDDMSLGFLKVVKDDKKDHFRYGVGSILGNPFPQGVLQQRSVNALYYKSKIASLPTTKSANNEVTIKYRHHGGIFPLIGSLGPIPKGASPNIKEEIAKDEFLIGNFEKTLGKLSDSGVFNEFA
jgi:hypothetical protein